MDVSLSKRKRARFVFRWTRLEVLTGRSACNVFYLLLWLQLLEDGNDMINKTAGTPAFTAPEACAEGDFSGEQLRMTTTRRTIFAPPMLPPCAAGGCVCLDIPHNTRNRLGVAAGRRGLGGVGGMRRCNL